MLVCKPSHRSTCPNGRWFLLQWNLEFLTTGWTAHTQLVSGQLGLPSCWVELLVRDESLPAFTRIPAFWWSPGSFSRFFWIWGENFYVYTEVPTLPFWAEDLPLYVISPVLPFDRKISRWRKLKIFRSFYPFPNCPAVAFFIENSTLISIFSASQGHMSSEPINAQHPQLTGAVSKFYV